MVVTKSVEPLADVDLGDVVTYTEYVHSAISALRKQLSHLAPSLRYVRETKDEISLQEFFDEIRDFYAGRTGRFKGSGIKMLLEKPFDNFVILINKGKLTQIVDNLILNSEYWLKEAVRRKDIEDPEITIRSEYPFLSIYDNGLGIDRSIENSLFQPFVTTKPGGRGLGRGGGLRRERAGRRLREFPVAGTVPPPQQAAAAHQEPVAG